MSAAGEALTPRILVCEDDDFKVEHAINPWMHPDLAKPEVARGQWYKMLDVLKQHVDIETARFPMNAPDEIFWTRDAYSLIEGTIVLANFKKPERQGETDFWRQWFAKEGYQTVESPATLEGGNVIEHGGVYYVGTGYRAGADDCKRLSDYFGAEFVGLPVTSDDYFHLDVAMLTVGDRALYYPAAFTPEAREILSDRLPGAVELNAEEAAGFCANSIAVGDTVFTSSHQPSFEEKLAGIGKTAIAVDLSAFKAIGGGGIHCLTNTLPA